MQRATGWISQWCRRSCLLPVLMGAVLLSPAVRPLIAAEKEEKNEGKRGAASTLTPKEMAEGWIMLFDGESTYGWKVEGPAKVSEGKIEVEGGAATLTTTSAFGDFDLMIGAKFEGGTGAQIVLNGEAYPIPAGKTWKRTQWKVESKANEHTVKTGKLLGSSKTHPGASHTPIVIRVEAGTKCELRNIRLKPTNLKSIFNGKDLTGWKVIPDHKSVFTVKDGAINVTNGGGDLQSEGQWKDFVLQLDVISNGEHLNSGIFFRSLPGEFWQGYEAQVRNEWQGYTNKKEEAAKPVDRTKPVDCGTGGIYNRQDSRRVVSSDHEWFTYTILADGPHIALWVNGYQTADFVDTAKDASSARKGRYLGKGAIDLQGHDPTTNLSFRNIRITELPHAK